MDTERARDVLDPATVARAFAAIPALAHDPPARVELASLWIKPGHHCNAAYRLTGAATGKTITATAFAVDGKKASAIVREAGAHRPGVAAACPHCWSAATPSGLIAQLFPHDYRLPTLAVCLDRDVIGRALHGQRFVQGVEPVGYRPGMRCQIRYDTSLGPLYGKVAVERAPGLAFTRHQRIHAALHGGGNRLRVAAPFRYVTELGLGLVVGVRGDSLHETLRQHGDVTDVMAVAAEAIASLHGQSVALADRVYGPDDELALLQGWVELIAAWYPALDASLRDCERQLQRTRPAPREPRALVHRDFYDKQVLIAADGVTLLDLDTVCAGDAEIDLGNFTGQFVLRGLQFGQLARCYTYAEQFIAAYPLPVDRERMRWYRRAALLRLACGYAARPHWHHLAPRLIEEATVQ